MKCDTWDAPQKSDSNMCIWNVRNHSPSDTIWCNRNCQLLQSENLKVCTATAASTSTKANGFKLCLELVTSWWLLLLSVICTVPVLLQKVILKQLGNFKCDLIRLSKGCLAYKLHNFRQVLLLLKNLLYFGPQWHKFWVILLIEVIQSTHVLAARTGNTLKKAWTKVGT